MESSKYIGRVGALAVALGIGTALTTGTGIAWADDAGSSSKSSSSSDSKGSGDSDSTSSKTSSDSTSDADTDAKDSKQSTRKGPLSRIGERVRKEAEAGVSRAEAAVERTQARLEKAQTRISERRAALQDKIDDVAGEALADVSEPVRRPFGVRPRPEEPEVPATPEAPAAPKNNSTAGSDTPRVTPAVVEAEPKPTAPARTKSVALKLREVREDVTERGLAAITTVAESVTKLPAGVLEPAPITSFAKPAAAQPDISTGSAELPETKATSVVSALLVAAGLSPLAAGTSPVSPGPSAALWAMAAWARRESDRVVNPKGAALTSVQEAAAVTTADVVPTAAAAPGTVVIGPGQTEAPVIEGSTTSTQTGWTTGNGSGTGVTDQWFVGGTDLGIMWDSGLRDAQGKPIIFTMFGDTYDVADPASNAGWRDNVLLRASDFNLNNGLQFTDALIHDGGDPNRPMWWRPIPGGLQRAGAAQIIDPAAIDALKRTNTYTLIPTSAIAGSPVTDADGNPVLDDDGNQVVTQYATVMSIKQWGQAGSWTTNWSAIAVSEDNGKSWNIDPDTVRMSSGGNANFQQNAMVYGNPEDATSYVDGDLEGERYVYVYGTPSGRQGSAYVARVAESQITNLDAYEYFAGDNGEGEGKWVVGTPSEAVAVIGTEGAAGSIFPETGLLGLVLKPLVSFLKFVYPAGFKPGGIFSAGGSGGNVSEMSVQYNETLDKYVVLYTDGGNNVVMRVSDSPQGTWSNATVLQANQGYGQNTGMYGPMIHPLSGTGQLQDDNDGYHLYYNLSQWNDYNVRMMRADLSNLRIT